MSSLASAAPRTAVRLRIAGRVQGVGYRAWMVSHASALGLDGWVRNRLDGTVEAVVAGPSERVDHLIGLCHGGPSVARVGSVTAETASDPGPIGFDQEATR